MILLDTNVVSELMRRAPDPSVMVWIDVQPQNILYSSSVTRAEIELGIAILPEGRRKQGLQAAAVRMFAEFHGRCLAFDEPAASRCRTSYQCGRRTDRGHGFGRRICLGHAERA
jgi:predicted nucleic acid-binding protein